MSGFRWETVSATLMRGNESIGFVCGSGDEWDWTLDTVHPESGGSEKTLAAAKHALLKAYAIANGVPVDAYDATHRLGQDADELANPPAALSSSDVAPVVPTTGQLAPQAPKREVEP